MAKFIYAKDPEKFTRNLAEALKRIKELAKKRAAEEDDF